MKRKNRKLDLHWSASISPFFRVIGGILGIIFLLFGTIQLYDSLTSRTITFDHSFKFGIAATSFGGLFLFACI